MSKYVSVGRLKCHSIYIILTGLSYIPKSRIIRTKYSVFTMMFMISLGEILCIILEVISYYLSKNNLVKKRTPNVRSGKSSSSNSLIKSKDSSYYPEEYQSKLKMALLIMLNAFMEAISTIYGKIYIEEVLHFSSIFLGIYAITNFFAAVVYLYFIMHYKLYKHHYFAMVGITIGIIISFCDDIDTRDKALVIPLSILFSFITPFKVIQKYINERLYLSVYKMIFFNGCCLMAYSLIFGLIFSFVPCDKIHFKSFCIKSFKNLFTDIFTDSGTIEKSFVSSISTFLYYAFLMMVIKYYNPTYLLISDCLSSLIVIIVKEGIIEKALDTGDYIQVVIGFTIILLFSLVYNEILILNFWNLNYNIKDVISRRGERDIDDDLNWVKEIDEGPIDGERTDLEETLNEIKLL